MLTKRSPVLALAAALSLSACVGDGDTTLPAPTGFVGGGLFGRYVSLGNSITAGFQSNGINDSLQVRSYPVMLAAKAQGPFNPPLLRTIPGAPGAPCPTPMIAPLTPAPAPVGGCVRITNPRFVSNLAVPGERIRDLVQFNPTSGTAGLHTLLLGPESQTHAMLKLDPTLVSVWIGNNDALAAALGGNLGPAVAGADSTLTPMASFQASLNTLTARVDSVIDVAVGQEDAILIGVVDPVLYAPLIQPGAYFFLARDVAGNFQGKPVNLNCSPVTALGTPNPLAANMISFQIVTSAIPEINCDPAVAPTTYLLSTAEQAVVRARIAAYNTAIQAAAADKGWIFVNPNTALAPLLAATTPAGRYDNIRKCQLLPTATNAVEFQTAVLNSCPVTGGTAAPNFFGALISFDGVHPSTAAHATFANILAAAINAKHGTSLSTS